MVLELNSELESALIAAARQQGLAPEVVATNILRNQLLPVKPPFEPQDDWERLVLSMASSTDAVLPNEALTAEGIYE